MKKFWPLVVLVVIAVGIYFFRNEISPAGYPSAPAGIISDSNSLATTAGNFTDRAADVPLNASASSTAPSEIASRAFSPAPPATNETSKLSPLMILDNARVVIHNYNSAFGENPVGTNPEITAALTGNNPKSANFITAESGLRVNGYGEMVDGYGTPFFFHQLSGHEMEIRSAGKDRVMWTLDDQLTR